ncbi:protein of unknown function DUF137 [Spirochaeta thermophila DSM 6578]|uniref:4-phosphopantoate--beta-alanine ligase n=1 Tax=Winmispira thermophila (strain ATCC 700085 / DSM 6578 / Z-1203) TaxID=869211 RepID=G0GCR8_WINT7|nr:4-phosphopantoate--beta-alanine ligase [Spirochaeta thermophila]AEJ60487.1 protein of unknown function DUF137 [Spirochaeta thermophila DSM 6578]
MSVEIPPDHPRYRSLLYRERLIEGMEKKVTAPAGLIAHGRGEAFDYLLGERTHPHAHTAIRQAAFLLLTSRHPVVSVNGNVVALCPEELVRLSKVTGAPLEVNLFYRSREREEAIARVLREHGAEQVLGVGAEAVIPELSSERRRVDPEGILEADCVFVPLEDGDRTEALVRLGKKVITVDLNPLSRTARTATVTIVDNIVRALPLLIEVIERHRDDPSSLAVPDYDNKRILAEALSAIVHHLTATAHELAD